MNGKPLLSVRGLTTEFTTPEGKIARALDDVSFDVMPGQTIGLVGESGSGKTTTLMSLMRLLPAGGRITAGRVMFNDINLLSLSEREMRDYRWKSMAIVFQGAMNALNPVIKVGDQIHEAIMLHNLMDEDAAEKRVKDLLEMVGIARTRRDQYPHQYSGGMLQRVMIQAQVLELLKEIQKALGLAIVLVTHDLGVVAEVCDSVVVMYGGKVAEYGTADHIYNEAQHPYTQKLLAAFPDVSQPGDTLASIPGTPPRLTNLPPGCRFEPRCHLKIAKCSQVVPPLLEVSPKHYVSCILREGVEADFR